MQRENCKFVTKITYLNEHYLPHPNIAPQNKCPRNVQAPYNQPNHKISPKWKKKRGKTKETILSPKSNGVLASNSTQANKKRRLQILFPYERSTFHNLALEEQGTRTKTTTIVIINIDDWQTNIMSTPTCQR